MGSSLRLVISKMLAQKLRHAYNIKCLFIDKIKNSAKSRVFIKSKNLRKRKILGSEMRTQAFALHSPYEFFFSCEQSKKRALAMRTPIKSKICSEASETRQRDRSCINHTASVPTTKYRDAYGQISIATRLLIHRLGNANASVRASLAS